MPKSQKPRNKTMPRDARQKQQAAQPKAGRGPEYGPGYPMLENDMVLIGKIATRARLDVGPVMVSDLDTSIEFDGRQSSQIEVIVPALHPAAAILMLAGVGEQVALVGNLLMMGPVGEALAPVFLLRGALADVSGKPPLRAGAYTPMLDHEGLVQLMPAGELKARASLSLPVNGAHPTLH